MISRKNPGLSLHSGVTEVTYLRLTP
ncbi:protein of unknown function [Streptomyces sp. KY75]|nr:protein of unknown function [Streptomyces sp. KY75]